ncbi:MAG: beta strand repeat-containing protein, partial [Ferruginibacter sp.]
MSNTTTFSFKSTVQRQVFTSRLLAAPCLLIPLFLLASLNNTQAQVSINTAGVAYTENFNSTATTMQVATATAGLPTGFKIGTDWAIGTIITTQAAGTTGAVFTTGGAYNYANGDNASSTERALGFLTSSGYTAPRSIIFAFTNNTGSTISSITVSWNYEKYRSGSRAINWTFFHGSTSTVATANTLGDASYVADANNTTLSNPPTSGAKNFTIDGLSIANGTTYYLRWTYTGVGGSTNAQGLAIDDFSITLNVAGTPSVAIGSSGPAAGNIVQGSVHNVLYTDTLTVSTTATTLNARSVTLSGTAAGGTDISNLKLWYQSGTVLNTTTATLLGTIASPVIGVNNFSGLSQSVPVGKSHLFITADVPCSAFTTRTCSVNAPVASSFTFAGSVIPNPVNTVAGNTQTITTAGNPSDVTNANAASGNTQLNLTWTIPAGCFDEIMVVATNAASVSGVPTGNGSAYTANTTYGSGTLLGNAFVIYKGTATNVVLSGLTNNTTYQIRIFVRKGSVWSAGADCSGTPSAPGATGDYRSRITGVWSAVSSWEKFTGGFWQPSTEAPDLVTANVTIQNGHTISLDVSTRRVNTLTVNSGGKLFCGTTYDPTGLSNNYLNVHGNIICNGVIGNGLLADNICFNVEGLNDTIRGSGDFSCNRIRKNTSTNNSTTLVMDMNVKSHTTATFLYNNHTAVASAFNFILAAGRTLDLTAGGNISIDGTNGIAIGNDSYGTYTIRGTLLVDSLYLTTNNNAFACWLVIDAGGIVNANQIVSSSSGLASHNLNMKNGSLLRILNTASCVAPFSNTGNNFVLEAGSTIEYAGATAQNVEGGIPYANLTVSGGNTKTLNVNTTVSGTFTLSSGTTYSQNALTTSIGNGGVLLANGGLLDAALAAGTISFAGNGTIKGTTAVSFNVLTVNAGLVKDSINNCNVQTLNLNGTGILSIGAIYQLNLPFNGIVNGNGGNFSTGADGGTLNFTGSGSFTGNSDPYNVFISGAVDFGVGNTTIQNGGRLRINAGGSVNTNAPFYATGSTLEYNWGLSGANAGLEWATNASTGRGVPHHVQIGTADVNTTRVSFGSSNQFRQANGDLNIGPATGGTGYRLSLSSVLGGDIRVGGHWTRAASGTFTPNGRSVTFNGSSVEQNITVLGGGTEVFTYLIVNKTGTQNLRLSSSPATDLSVTGASGGNTLQLLNGNVDLNGRTINYQIIFNGFVNNIAIDGPVGNTTRRVNSSIPGGTLALFNNDPGTARVTSIVRLSANASLLSFSAGTVVAVGGIAQNSGINFGPSYSFILGSLQINTWGYVETNPPFYGNNATLIYNPGSDYKRFTEWSTTTGVGYPFNILVQNNTNLRVNDDNIPVNNGGNGTADRALAGTLTISAGSSVVMGDSTENNKLTIGGNLVLNGTLTMPSTTTAIGADVYLAGNWNRSATGVFNHNERAVFFNGNINSTITASGGQYFPYLYLVKSTATQTLSLLDDIRIGKIFTITTGKLDLAAKDATLLSDAGATAQFGKVGLNADVLYSGTGRFVVERYIPTGTGAGQHGKSWQFLAVPTNGGQTIKQAWQEGAVTANGNPNPGYGTQVTGNVGGSSAGATALGFDVFTPAGPSVKFYNNGIWTGIPNTNTTPAYRKEGYMVFVRGDRSVIQFNQAATSTVLRTRGKLFVPVSNPAPTITIPAGSFQSVGNPYASAIEFTALDGPGVPDVDPVFYVWDPLLNGTNGLGGYQMISANNGDFYPTPGGTINYPTGIRCTKIQSGQAFLMRATGAGGDVNFNEDCKVAGSQNTFRIPTNTRNRSYLRMYLHQQNNNDNPLMDGAVLTFDPTFSMAVDYQDAQKWMNAGENMGLLNSGKILSLDARGPVLRTDTIQIHLTNLRRPAYRLRLAAENID